MLNLLAENSQIYSYIFLGIILVVFIVFIVLSNRRAKKHEEDENEKLNAVKPGNKVKTIGGICGIVVEINPEDDTFVLETGSETSGKCFIKFDKKAIYQTDAKPEPKDKSAQNEEKPAQNEAPEAPATEEVKEEPEVKEEK